MAVAPAVSAYRQTCRGRYESTCRAPVPSIGSLREPIEGTGPEMCGWLSGVPSKVAYGHLCTFARTWLCRRTCTPTSGPDTAARRPRHAPRRSLRCGRHRQRGVRTTSSSPAFGRVIPPFPPQDHYLAACPPGESGQRASDMRAVRRLTAAAARPRLAWGAQARARRRVRPAHPSRRIQSRQRPPARPRRHGNGGHTAAGQPGADGRRTAASPP